MYTRRKTDGIDRAEDEIIETLREGQREGFLFGVGYGFVMGPLSLRLCGVRYEPR